MIALGRRRRAGRGAPSGGISTRSARSAGAPTARGSPRRATTRRSRSGSRSRAGARLTLRGHFWRVWSVAWNPDGTRLASASLDATVRVWEVETGPRDAQPPPPRRAGPVGGVEPGRAPPGLGGRRRDGPGPGRHAGVRRRALAPAPAAPGPSDRRRSRATPTTCGSGARSSPAPASGTGRRPTSSVTATALEARRARPPLVLDRMVGHRPLSRGHASGQPPGGRPRPVRVARTPRADVGPGGVATPGRAVLEGGGPRGQGIPGLRRLLRPRRAHLGLCRGAGLQPGGRERSSILFGADDTARLWLNGEKVHESLINRRATPDQDAVAGDLARRLEHPAGPGLQHGGHPRPVPAALRRPGGPRPRPAGLGRHDEAAAPGASEPWRGARTGRGLEQLAARIRLERRQDYVKEGRWGRVAADLAEGSRGRPRRPAEVVPRRRRAPRRGADRSLRASNAGRCCERFGDARDWVTAERISKACLLRPDDPAIVAQAAALADRGLTSAPDNPWTLFAAGLAAYRTGDHESALDRLRRGRDASTTIDRSELPCYEACTLLVEAMAYARLDRSAMARRVPRPGRPDPRGPVPGGGGGHASIPPPGRIGPSARSSGARPSASSAIRPLRATSRLRPRAFDSEAGKNRMAAEWYFRVGGPNSARSPPPSWSSTSPTAGSARRPRCGKGTGPGSPRRRFRACSTAPRGSRPTPAEDRRATVPEPDEEPSVFVPAPKPPFASAAVDRQARGHRRGRGRWIQGRGPGVLAGSGVPRTTRPPPRSTSPTRRASGSSRSGSPSATARRSPSPARLHFMLGQHRDGEQDRGHGRARPGDDEQVRHEGGGDHARAIAARARSTSNPRSAIS